MKGGVDNEENYEIAGGGTKFEKKRPSFPREFNLVS